MCMFIVQMMSLMAEWLEQVPQWHEMYCHDLEVMSWNPGKVELWVHSPSVLSCTWTKYILVSSVDYNLHPGFGTRSFTVSSPLGRIQCIFCSWSHVLQFCTFCMTVPTAGCTEGSMEWAVYPTHLHATISGNWTPDLLILSPIPYPFCLMLHVLQFSVY